MFWAFFVYNVKQKVPRERQMKPDSWCHLDNAGKCWSLQWLCGKIFMCDPHLHKIFCFLLKTKGKACLAGSVSVTLVKLRAGSGLGVIQGRVPCPWGEGAEPGASPAQQGQAAGQGLGKMTENTISLFCHAMTSFPCIPHYQERAECSKCWFFWAVPGFDPCPGALTHPELSWSTNPNSLSMAPSVGQPLKVMEISFSPSVPLSFPPKAGEASPRRDYIIGVESLLAESSPWNGWTLNIWNYSSLQELKCKNAAEVQECQTGNLMEMLGWAGCTQHSSCKWSGKFSCKQQDFPSFFERPFDRLILSNQSFTVSKLK